MVVGAGNLDDLKTTITYGIRNGNPNSRQSEMPAWGGGDPLPDDQLNGLAEYVLSLSKASTDPVAAQVGLPIFAERCSPCHGEAGEGSQAVGAPALANGIWLYKGKSQKAEIISQIKNPKGGVMPSWTDRGLDEATLKILAVSTSIPWAVVNNHCHEAFRRLIRDAQSPHLLVAGCDLVMFLHAPIGPIVRSGSGRSPRFPRS